MIRGIETEHSSEWHRDRFAEFTRYKLAGGEPTPHMRLVQWMSDGLSDREKLWRAGCYAAGYSVLTGEAIWTHWTYERFQSDPVGFEAWLRANWQGIHTRTPRRCVRTPDKFARCLFGWTAWMEQEFPRLRAAQWTDPVAEYDGWWASVSGVPFFGRYIAIRVLELMRRWNYMTAPIYDIRAIGAHSPIRCLMLLRDTERPRLQTGDPGIVNDIAAEVMAETAEQPGCGDLTHFPFAAILCEYRASYEDRKDYPGNQTDEELSYWNGKHGDYWRQRYDSQLLAARLATVPHEMLGELNGWTGRRPDVAALLRKEGIVWSDLIYDYRASSDVRQPTSRTEASRTSRSDTRPTVPTRAVPDVAGQPEEPGGQGLLWG